MTDKAHKYLADMLLERLDYKDRTHILNEDNREDWFNQLEVVARTILSNNQAR